jgi:hypothetical protein
MDKLLKKTEQKTEKQEQEVVETTQKTEKQEQEIVDVNKIDLSNLEFLQDEIADYSVIENPNPNLHYQWADKGERESILSYQKIGFRPAKDDNINCPYAEKQKDGTWTYTKFGITMQLWCVPKEIEQKIREIRKARRAQRLSPAKTQKDGISVSGGTSNGLGVRNFS